MTTERVAELAAKVEGKRLERARDVAGIVWVREHSGRRYAMVPASGGGYYKVDGYGCRCVGYQNHGYCRHHDAVMLRLAKRAGANPAPVYTTARDEAGNLEILADGWVVGVVAPVEPDHAPDPAFEAWLDEQEAADRRALDAAEAMGELFPAA